MKYKTSMYSATLPWILSAIISTLTNFAVYGQVLFTAICLHSTIHSDNSLKRKTNAQATILSAELLSESSREYETRKDYFLNFSSHTKMLEGHDFLSTRQ